MGRVWVGTQRRAGGGQSFLDEAGGIGLRTSIVNGPRGSRPGLAAPNESRSILVSPFPGCGLRLSFPLSKMWTQSLPVAKMGQARAGWAYGFCTWHGGHLHRAESQEGPLDLEACLT